MCNDLKYKANCESCKYRSWKTVNKKNTLNTEKKSAFKFSNAFRQLLQMCLYCKQDELQKYKEICKPILRCLIYKFIIHLRAQVKFSSPKAPHWVKISPATLSTRYVLQCLALNTS